jgi:hypothetical protein
LGFFVPRAPTRDAFLRPFSNVAENILEAKAVALKAPDWRGSSELVVAAMPIAVPEWIFLLTHIVINVCEVACVKASVSIPERLLS